jgi:hypothetical protein
VSNRSLSLVCLVFIVDMECVCFLKWMDGLPHDREFRCYIRNGRLTAISQYHCYDSFFKASRDEAALTRVLLLCCLSHLFISSIWPHNK